MWDRIEAEEDRWSQDNGVYLSPGLEVYDNSMDSFYAAVAKIRRFLQAFSKMCYVLGVEGWF